MPKDIQRDRVQQLQAQGAAILEVLPSKEFQQEHLAGAVSLPLGELRAESAERVIGADKQRHVITYCQGSDWDLSSRAAWRLESLGYTNVYRYAAGKVDWLSAGLPSEGELANELRIRDIVHRDIATCRLDQRMGDLHLTDDLCVVLNEAGIVMGDLRGKALQADPSTPVEQVMDPGVSTYRPNISVQEVAHQLLESGAQRVLVSDGEGRLIGWISRKDAEQALDEHRHHHDGPVLAHSGG